jgi:hypothetical protein
VKIPTGKTAQFADALDCGRRTFTRRCGGLAVALLVEAVPFARGLAASGVDSRAAAQLQAFLEGFATTEVAETSRDLSAGAFRRKRKSTSAKLLSRPDEE